MFYKQRPGVSFEAKVGFIKGDMRFLKKPIA